MATYLVKGIHYQKPLDLIVASFLLGLLFAFVRPLLQFLSLPLIVITLGLFIFVINALLLYFVGWLLSPSFVVPTFGSAFLGGLVISVVSWLLNILTGTNSTRVRVRRGPPPDRGGGGPVIDV